MTVSKTGRALENISVFWKIVQITRHPWQWHRNAEKGQKWDEVKHRHYMKIFLTAQMYPDGVRLSGKALTDFPSLLDCTFQLCTNRSIKEMHFGVKRNNKVDWGESFMAAFLLISLCFHCSTCKVEMRDTTFPVLLGDMLVSYWLCKWI